MGITRLFKVWVRGDSLKKQEIGDQLVKARRQAENRAIQLIREAISPTSEAAKIVEQANTDMDIQHRLDLDNNVPKTPKTKRRLTAEKVFKIDLKDFERTADKGMDFAWYAYNWLLSDLYPYYWTVVKNNPGCDVYLIEDNAGAHKRAREHLVGHILQQGIQFAP